MTTQTISTPWTRSADEARVPEGRRGTSLTGAAHAFFRMGIGLLFFHHGAPKLFGWFGGLGEAGSTAPLFSLFGLAGVLEVFGGLLILLGLFTRPVAAVLALEMAIAFVYAHVPNGWVPIQNGGELALVYLLSFVLLAAWGAGPASLDAWRERLRGTRRAMEELTRAR